MKILQLLIVCLISLNVFPAGPVTHTYIAERWIAKAHPTWTKEQQRSFIIGTLFPDIRYPTHIARERTHEVGVTLQSIEATTSLFEQGKKFHAFVDVFRENVVNKSSIHKVVKRFLKKKNINPSDLKPYYIDSFLKFVEDAALYPKQTWGQIKWDLEHIEPEEKNYGVSDDQVKKWHGYLRDCLTIGPVATFKTHDYFKKNPNFSPALLEIWSKIIPELCNTKKLKKHIKVLVAKFDKEFGRFVKAKQV